ncbi:DUF2141 domain-containing protein [Emticicia sp. TH156]|uniref:DUF2141 domain-containing protein n=1 Tax=Emticicia sp. TH156 TaxID=2067454 RepID=UPI000C793514|nr:DUF2141 domain-containing protein [Emticicia sp. TH156]PLK44761.1 hypothetical protein C0V77_09955 [Emticicia sp. TH156]
MKKMLFLWLLSFGALAQQPVLKVKVSGFENTKGKLMLEVVNASQQPQSRMMVPIGNKLAMADILGLSPGQYSVRVYHDVNGNQKLDTNLIGIPKEPWGMSNNVKAVLGPPDFKESLFWLKEDKTIEIVLH